MKNCVRVTTRFPFLAHHKIDTKKNVLISVKGKYVENRTEIVSVKTKTTLSI